MKNVNILFLSLAFLFSSCSYLKDDEKKKNKQTVARAFGNYLEADDLKGVITTNVSSADSAAIISNFIDNWLHQQVVLHKAENNLDDEKKDVQAQLEEYRNSLIRYAYEKELIEQRLDTVVSDREIENFYSANPDNFQLRSNIVKVNYIKLNKKSPKQDKAKKWFNSDSGKDKQSLIDYCHQYAINYYFDDENWLLFEDLLKEIPIKTYDQEQYLQNNRNIEIEDSSFIYLINIKGFKIKNSVSPLSFEKNNIKAMIVNQRKLKLISQMEKQAYDDAWKKGDVEVFKKN